MQELAQGTSSVQAKQEAARPSKEVICLPVTQGKGIESEVSPVAGSGPQGRYTSAGVFAPRGAEAWQEDNLAALHSWLVPSWEMAQYLPERFRLLVIWCSLAYLKGKQMASWKLLVHPGGMGH